MKYPLIRVQNVSCTKLLFLNTAQHIIKRAHFQYFDFLQCTVIFSTNWPCPSSDPFPNGNIAAPVHFLYVALQLRFISFRVALQLRSISYMVALYLWSISLWQRCRSSPFPLQQRCISGPFPDWRFRIPNTSYTRFQSVGKRRHFNNVLAGRRPAKFTMHIIVYFLCIYMNKSTSVCNHTTLYNKLIYVWLLRGSVFLDFYRSHKTSYIGFYYTLKSFQRIQNKRPPKRYCRYTFLNDGKKEFIF